MHTHAELLIQTHSLQFGFAHRSPILREVSLQVERGAIYGFLGPNGAGKTTTIRLLLGLLPAPAQSIQLFGQFIETSAFAILGRVGAFIETPSLYGHLSALDNLEITRLMRGSAKKRIYAVLEQVGLASEAHTKVNTYSLGMKQRLALALALLAEPELLILDEPTNGLDPNGINDTRQLLQELNKTAGTTLFISSHLLTEMEKMISHVGILHQGRLVFQGSLPTLQAQQAVGSVIQLQTNDNSKAQALLQASYPVSLMPGGMLQLVIGQSGQVHQLTTQLADEGLSVYNIQESIPDLEQFYLSLTNH